MNLKKYRVRKDCGRLGRWFPVEKLGKVRFG